MAFRYTCGVLAVLADPRYYPHVERHLHVLLQLCETVHVLAVYPCDAQPTVRERVHFHRIAEKIPQGMGGFFRTMNRMRKTIRQLRPDVVEAVDPPCLAAASLALAGLSARLVYFSMEIFPELPSLADRPFRRLVWRWVECLAVLRAQAVLTVNSSVAQVISRNLGGRPVEVVRSMPWKRAQVHSPEKQAKLHALCHLPAGTPLLVYQGVVESGRGLQPLADALKMRPEIHLAIMGYGPWENWARQRSSEQSNIHYLGAFPFERLMELAQGASAGVVCIEAVSRSFALSLPGKLFEYVSNGLPVLGSPLPEIAGHIQSFGIGEVAGSWSKTDLQRALDTLMKKASEGCYTKSITHAAQEWCWECESQKLKSIIAAENPSSS